MPVIFFCLLFAGLIQKNSAAIHVFACEPEWASLTREIGGENVEVFAATTPFEDPHHITAKPSLLAAMRQARVLICSGSDLEAGWLPVLLNKAGSSSLMQGGKNSIYAASLVKRLEVPQRLDRSLGDIHPHGNPHVHLDPYNLMIVAEKLSSVLAMEAPSLEKEFQQNLRTFQTRMNSLASRLEMMASGLRNRHVISHHPSFSYLENWLGLERVDTLEPVPGVPPSIRQLSSLLTKTQNVCAITRTAIDPSRPARWLSEKTGIPELVLPFTPGDSKDSGDLFQLLESSVARLLEACGNA